MERMIQVHIEKLPEGVYVAQGTHLILLKDTAKLHVMLPLN